MPIHIALMPDGSLVTWNRVRGNHMNPDERFAVLRITSSGTYNYDTITKLTVPALDQSHSDLFCAGHTLLEDGKLLFVGGHEDDDEGIKDILTYTAGDSSLVKRTSLTSKPRRYPSTLRLADRRVLIVAGTDKSENPNDSYTTKTPTLWLDGDLGSGLKLPGNLDDYQAVLDEHDTYFYYPFLYTNPSDGKVVYPGPRLFGGTATSGVFETLNLPQLTWSDLLSGNGYPVDNNHEWYGSSAMFDGKVLKSGGSVRGHVNSAVDTSLYIDLLATTPAWANAGKNGSNVAGKMRVARKNHTLVVLPDGKFVAMGGNFEGEHDSRQQEEDLRYKPEAWDSANPTAQWLEWNQPAGNGVSINIERPYHSVAILLPDAKVLVAGGEGDVANNNRKVYIFSPPYANSDSWESSRASLSTSTTEIGYNESFSVTASAQGSGNNIAKMVILPLGSVTHAFNQNQAGWTVGSPNTNGTFNVTMPNSTKKASPGHYMLFAVDNLGRPSVAKIIKLRDWSRRYASEYSLSVGTWSNGPGTDWYKKLFLADNQYVGDYIASQPDGSNHKVQIEFTSQTSSFSSPSKLRAHAELRANAVSGFGTISLAIESYNFSTSTWSGNTAQIVDDEDKTYGVTITTNASNFVNSGGQMRVRYTFTRTMPFQVRFDSLEYGAP